MILEIILIIAVYVVWRMGRRDKHHPSTIKINNQYYRIVPKVGGKWPIVGHGLAFSRDIIGFVRSAQQQYGNVFRIKVFKKDIIVVCDHNLKDQFFKATEKSMSLYEVLK